MSAIQKIQKSLHSAIVRKLKLSLAFYRMHQFAQAKSVRQLSNSLMTSVPHPHLSEPVALHNKHLYLCYVQQVLTKKQEQLLRFQKQLQAQRRHFIQKQYIEGIGKPLTEMSKLEILQRKLEAVREECLLPLLKLHQGSQPHIKTKQKEFYHIFEKKERQLTEQVRWKREMTDGVLREEYQRLAEAKQQMKRKMAQFDQLNAYQKYLNQFQKVLEEKEAQLESKEGILGQAGDLWTANRYPQGQQSYQSGNAGNNSSYVNQSKSSKRRTRIFDRHNHISASSPSRLYNNQLNTSKSNNNETFGARNHYQSAESTIKEESSIKIEDQQVLKRQGQYPQQQSSSYRQTSSPKINTKSEKIFINEQSSVTQINPNPRNSSSHCHNSKSPNPSIREKISSHSVKTGLSLHRRHNNLEQYQVHTRNFSIQTSQQSGNECRQRLRRQRLIIKFAGLWLKLSSHKAPYSSTISCEGKATSSLHFYLHRWRLNAVYDQSIPERVRSMLQLTDRSWQRKCQQLKSQNLFPFSQISLKRKRYVELFIDYERKVMHHRKILSSLGAILRNKNMRERICVKGFFMKFCWACKTKGIEKCKTGTITIYSSSPKRDSSNIIEHGSYHGASRLFSGSSSNVMNEGLKIDIVHGGKRQLDTKDNQITTNQLNKYNKDKTNSHQASHPHLTLSPNKVSKKNPTSRLTPSVQVKDKQNILQYHCNQNKNSNRSLHHSTITQQSPSSNKQCKVDVKKLKAYVLQKQQTQKQLAIKCLKTEGILKLVCLSLAGKVNQRYNCFWNRMRRKQEEQRWREVQKRVGCYQFKWELFMTKCRLALVNNSTKIGYLQQVLGFAITEK